MLILDSPRLHTITHIQLPLPLQLCLHLMQDNFYSSKYIESLKLTLNSDIATLLLSDQRPSVENI